MYQIFDLSVSKNVPLANANDLKQSPCQKQGIYLRVHKSSKNLKKKLNP